MDHSTLRALPPALVIGSAPPETRAALARFSVRLSARGWRIATLPADRLDPSAAAADLAICDAIGRDPEDFPYLSPAGARATPMLVAVEPARLCAWRAKLGDRTEAIFAEDLWRWWGPERMQEELIRTTPPVPVADIVVGARWVAVETESGFGLAAMPMLSGAAPQTPETSLVDRDWIGRDLRDLAALARSFAGSHRAIGCAAINAGLPAPDPALRRGEEDGLMLPAEASVAGTRVVVVGRFPKLPEKLPHALVLEKTPGPDDLPAEAAGTVVPGSDHLVITASAWSNGTLAELVRLASRASVTLVGPGTPLSPALHDYGISRLAGFVAEDRQAIKRIVAEGGGVKLFKPYGKQVVLAR